MVTREINHHSQIADAATTDEIVEALDAFGLDKVVERLRYLRSLDDDLVNDEQPMNLESLRSLATLLIERPELPKPGIGVSDDGMLQIEWDIVPAGMLAMVFMPGGAINYAAASGPVELGRARPEVHGSAAYREALAALTPFMTHLRTR